MPIKISRRQALAGSAAMASTLAMPSLSRAMTRPVLTHGVQSGDVAHDGAVIWARADREANMMVEWSTTDSFANARRVQPLSVGDATDFTGKMALRGLPSDQDIFYRVSMNDLSDNTASEPVVGHFRTAPAGMRDISFVWSGDTAGQGWGIDEDRGGMTTYATMAGHNPDFMIHSGDTVYADGPLKAEVELKDGTLWKNLLVEEKDKVAETLQEYRAQYLYNMLDKNVRAFNAAVPVMYQWDDHEVTNNWYPNEVLASDDRYTEKSVRKLAARSARAFHEMYPVRVNTEEPHRVYRKVSYGPLLDIFFLDMRTYRGDNTTNDQAEGAAFLGAEQLAWLKRELTASTATWKIFAADMPIGMIVRDGDNFENGANGDGPVMGREADIADLLSFVKHGGVKNTVWLTADVHYTAAHHYSPDRAQFQDFDAFWEFVSGPLHAGTFGPNDYDNTFGVEVRYAKHPTEEMGVNLPPSDGYQFFGKVDIDAATQVMTVRLMDSADAELWKVELTPEVVQG